MTMMATATDVLEAVRAIPDPEIPVITIEGLGILRSAEVDGSGSPHPGRPMPTPVPVSGRPARCR